MGGLGFGHTGRGVERGGIHGGGAKVVGRRVADINVDERGEAIMPTW